MTSDQVSIVASEGVGYKGHALGYPNENLIVDDRDISGHGDLDFTNQMSGSSGYMGMNYIHVHDGDLDIKGGSTISPAAAFAGQDVFVSGDDIILRMAGSANGFTRETEQSFPSGSLAFRGSLLLSGGGVAMEVPASTARISPGELGEYPLVMTVPNDYGFARLKIQGKGGFLETAEPILGAEDALLAWHINIIGNGNPIEMLIEAKNNAGPYSSIYSTSSGGMKGDFKAWVSENEAKVTA